MLSSPVQDTPGASHLDILPVTRKAHCDWICCWVPAPFFHCCTLCMLGPGQTGFRGCPWGPVVLLPWALHCQPSLPGPSSQTPTQHAASAPSSSLYTKVTFLRATPPAAALPLPPFVFLMLTSRLAHLEWKLHEGVLSGFSMRICQVSNDTTSF